MSPGIALELHWWRGIGPAVQRDLFFYGFRLGIVTISVCRVCVIDSYSKVRGAVVDAVRKAEGDR